jgi:hypothetical protein
MMRRVLLTRSLVAIIIAPARGTIAAAFPKL